MYSIWICTNPDEKHRNTITQYSLSPVSLFGKTPDETDRSYDMLSLIMICLDNNTDSENEIISLLTTLFSSKINAQEKKSVLQSKHGITMTKPLDEEVNNMCNISEMYYEDGMKNQLAQIIKLMLGDNKSYEEIANTLHMSTGDVKQIAETVSATVSVLR